VKLVYERSRPGRRAGRVPETGVEPADVPAELRRAKPPRLPEIAEPDLVRHFTELSTRTFGIDTGFYPLGSCTMKYNPRVNERAAALGGFRDLHREFVALGVSVFGVSSQETAYQQEFVERNHVPFEMLSDRELALTRALRLPTFEYPATRGGPPTLIKRMAWFVERGPEGATWQAVNRQADVTVTGPARSLLLILTRRLPLTDEDTAKIGIDGDTDLVQHWLDNTAHVSG